MPISVLIVDDHPVVRDGLTAMLATSLDFEVVGAAATGSEAIRLSMKFTPDVALMDLELPPTNGIQTIADLRSCSPRTKILVFTAFRDDERVIGAVTAGAQGYLLKGTPRGQLFDTIKAIHAGSKVFERDIARALVRHIRAPDQALLTARQLEVIGLVGRGLSNREIANLMRITERTVKYHLATIFDKLGVGNRTEAVATAMRLRLIKPP